MNEKESSDEKHLITAPIFTHTAGTTYFKSDEGHYRDGLSKKARAELTKESAANISRTLPFLLEEGMI